MASPLIVCPDCKTPATLWFNFGGREDPHSYYRCQSCGLSCAVQHDADYRPGFRSAWVQKPVALDFIPRRNG